jgi:hypothetical protein
VRSPGEKTGTGQLLQHPGAKGSTRANWMPVGEMLPAQAQPVLIAYQFMDDDYLTVDMGELDGNRWLYLGGGPILDGDVHFWAHPPEVPGVPAVANASQADGRMEVAA